MLLKENKIPKESDIPDDSNEKEKISLDSTDESSEDNDDSRLFE